MSNLKKKSGPRRPNKAVYTTRSGNTFKLHRSISEKIKAKRDARARKRAAYLATLPKGRLNRILYKLNPKRQLKYWFSREGGIMALKIFGICTVVGFLFIVGVFAYFRKDLPNINDISGRKLGGSITYYDNTGKTVLWQDYDAVKRVPVAGDQISNYVKQATIAIEDKNFYKHGAFDAQGIGRAVYKDITNKSGRIEGGSTITQQLVKLNQSWTNDRTIARKIKELILAVELEREYSKDEILTGYLNIAPYGNIQYGVETASRDYFNKSAKDLTLAESAMMAAIPQAPSRYSPYGPSYDPEKLVGRQQYILEQMAEQGMISKEEAAEAKKVDVIASIKPPSPKYEGIKAPYFVLAAKQELEEKYGDKTVQRGGWQVTTTLDLRLQELAEKQVADGIAQIKRHGGDVAAFAAIDVQTAELVAIVGGPDFSNKEYGQLNYTKTWLPPGSSFKPYDYTALINETTNTGAGSVLYDVQSPLPGWACTNKARPKDGGNCLHDYDFKYPGPLTVRYSLGGSRNVPAVKAMLTPGVNKTIEIAESMGLTSGYKCFEDTAFKKETQCYGSAAIGDGAYLHLDEHVNGYATLSRMGVYKPATYIRGIVDAKGKTIALAERSDKQVIKPDTAYIINDILSDPNASYLRPDRKFHNFEGWKFGIKTGTTNDAKDGLMMSYSSKYAAGVWVGYHNRQREMTGAMENMTQPIIRSWMREAHRGQEAKNWDKPASVQSLAAYIITRHFSSQHEVIPSPSNDLFPSWYKPPEKQTAAKQTIDKISGKLATSCTPEGAKETTSNSNDNMYSADIFVNAKKAASLVESDDVHKCDDARPNISVTPQTCTLSSCPVQVAVSQGTHPLSSDQYAGLVELYANDQLVSSQNVSGPSNVLFTYTPTSTSPISFKARVVDSVLYESTATAADVVVSGGTSAGSDSQIDPQPTEQ